MFTHSNGINIPHLSASTINSFITNRNGFYQSKVKGKPFKGNVYTARGTAVEHCINMWVETGIEDAVSVALSKYNEECDKAEIHKFDSDRADIAASVEKMAPFALGIFQGLSEDQKPTTQYKFSTNLNGVKRPIIGYLDFLFEGKRVRDTKVVSKTPSSLKQDYQIQGALYKHAMQLPVTFDFIIPNKAPAHKAIELTDDEFLFGISYMTRAAQVIEEIEECENPTRMMELWSFPDLSAMFNQRDKDEACEIWNIQR